jgi:hypothetical protein
MTLIEPHVHQEKYNEEHHESILLTFSVFALSAVSSAHAQTVVTGNGYVTLSPGPTVNTIVGGGVVFTPNIFCQVGGVATPVVTLYVSTSANSLGTQVGTAVVGSNGGQIGYAFQSAGTYYVNEFLTLNGASCTTEVSPAGSVTSTRQPVVVIAAN